MHEFSNYSLMSYHSLPFSSQRSDLIDLLHITRMFHLKQQYMNRKDRSISEED